MSRIQAALGSLYDSLNGLFFRMANNNPQSLWVSRVMLRVGEVQQALGETEGSETDVDTAYGLSGRASSVAADDASAVAALLTAIETFLETLAA